jgi:hypothetical protein
MAVHVSILESSLICLVGCAEAPLDIGSLCMCRICPLWWEDKMSARLLSQHIVADQLLRLWYSERAQAKRCRAQRPSISAWNELAVEDRS